MRKALLVLAIVALVLVTMLFASSIFQVYQGGTGASSLTAHGVLIGEGSSAIVASSPGTLGNCFMSNGSTSDPTFQTCGGGGGGGGAVSFVSLTDGTPITWNIASAGIANATVTLVHTTSTRAINLSNLANGSYGTLLVKQDSTGGAVLTLGTGCSQKVLGSAGGQILLTSTANAIDVLSFVYDGTNCYWNYGQNFN